MESRRGSDAVLRERYPLELISPKNDDSMNSTFGNRADLDRETAGATLHPSDAAPRRIATGDSIRVFNDRGSCVLRVTVASDIAPGVVCTPSMRWPKLAPERRNINALTSERLTDMGGGPTFYSCLVQVEKAGD